jgi:hypothetical protein
MIYLIVLFSASFEAFDNKIESYSSLDEKNAVFELLRKKKYDAALSIATDRNLIGCIKFIKGDVEEGIKDIEESAAKGNIFSCELFLLFNLKVEEEELVKYIEKELGVYGDSTFSFKSSYIRYLVLPPESLYAENKLPDSVLYPYIIFKSGIKNLAKNPEKTQKDFESLIEKYPNSVPAIVARNILRAVKNKAEEKK